MHQVDCHQRLLADMHSNDDATVLAAATKLLELGEYGTPVGTYLLKAGKAALRQRRLADAVVLLYHGLKVAEPQSLLWAELLANRAIACAQHGLYPNAIQEGNQFLGLVDALPEMRRWLPYVHHAIGFAHDHLQRYSEAARHFGLALDRYTDPLERDSARCDLASALAMSGQAGEAARVLDQVNVVAMTGLSQFGYFFTLTVVRTVQGRFAEAVDAGDRAEALAEGQEEKWATPLAELRLWLSKAVWACGNRHRSAILALQAAVMAQEQHHLALCDAATDWLAEIRDRGGVRNA